MSDPVPLPRLEPPDECRGELRYPVTDWERLTAAESRQFSNYTRRLGIAIDFPTIAWLSITTSAEINARPLR